MTRTADGQGTTLIFRDDAGEYYLVPRQTVERGRVPAERRAEIERLMERAQDAQSGAGDDVQGHLLPAIGGLIICFEVGMMIGFAMADAQHEAGDLWGQTLGQQVNQIVQNTVNGGGRPR